jgi:NosR/NirI family nitrite reductase transcriptional regulator
MTPRTLIRLALVCALSCAIGALAPAPARAAGGGGAGRILAPDAIAPAAPDAALAAALFGRPAAALTRVETPAPGWEATGPDGPLGVIASTWEVAGSVGYSGRPLDALVAVDRAGRIAGARLMRHDEPILTLGVSDADIAAYVAGFAGLDLSQPVPVAFEARAGLPPVIARATVSTGVIRDGILRTARTTALAHGLVGGGAAAIDRVTFAPRSWDALVAEGALAHVLVSMTEAAARLDGGENAPPPGEGAFLEVWAGVIDPPSIGRSLLGQQGFTAAMGALGPGDAALFVGSRGLHSHRGTEWTRSGLFDRIEVIQGAVSLRLRAEDYRRVDRLAAEGAPELKERSVFRLPATPGFDPAAPFRLEIEARRPKAGGGEVSFVTALDAALPAAYRLAPPPVEDAPLWVAAWERRAWSVGGLLAMLGVLFLILIFQDPFARRARLWRGVRLGFLAVSVVWLGWIEGAQLSVVQVVAFLQSLLTGFRWETFLIEPMIFTLWGFVALGLLFVGRGVYCGWLCPFGALQELLSAAAQRLRIPQVTVPFAVQERLWAIKYVAFIAILAVSFHDMKLALKAAEIEPFKTAVSLRFERAWPFVAFALGLLAAGLFIERFYCRYLCPLGAALGIPAKMKLFDWLHRRPQCGRECRLCEQKCTVGAIDPLGRINPNECILCLRCQSIYFDETACTVLKSRAARLGRGAAS